MTTLFRFDYVPEEDLQPEFILFTPGEAQFIIKKCFQVDKAGQELRTQAGDRKLNLLLDIVDCKGERGVLMDNLISSPNLAWKTKALLEAVGKPELYSRTAAFDPEQLVGLQGRATLKTQSNPAYKDKSIIAKYLPFDAEVRGRVSFNDKTDTSEDDALPF